MVRLTFVNPHRLTDNGALTAVVLGN